MAFDINLNTKNARAAVDALTSKITHLGNKAQGAENKLQRALGGGFGGAKHPGPV